MVRLTILGVIFAVIFISGCSSSDSFIKTQNELPSNEGIVIFPIEVHETYVNGNTLFVEKHASGCSMDMYNPEILETTSMFPIADKNITAPKSWHFTISKIYYHIPKGMYTTSMLNFFNYSYFALDQPQTKIGTMCGHSFAVDSGKINYWGRCRIKIEYNILDKKLAVVSFVIFDKGEEDIAAFKKAHPNLSTMNVVTHIGKRLAGTK